MLIKHAIKQLINYFVIDVFVMLPLWFFHIKPLLIENLIFSIVSVEFALQIALL